MELESIRMPSLKQSLDRLINMNGVKRREPDIGEAVDIRTVEDDSLRQKRD